MDSAPESIDPHHRKYAEETRSSEELAARFLTDKYDTSDGCHAMTTLHYRGGREEFEIGKRFAESKASETREAASSILGQLGWDKKTFLTESVDLLIPLLSDPADSVVESALIALGHRRDPRSIPYTLPFITHANVDVRYGAVAALSQRDDPDAIAGLIELSRDSEAIVRDWATFGLGQMTDVDTPELRDALAARLTDTDAETRGEALIGLAERKDERTFASLCEELKTDFYETLALEAAENLADPRLLPLLNDLRKRTESDETGKHLELSFDAAIEACGGGKPKSDPPDRM